MTTESPSYMNFLRSENSHLRERNATLWQSNDQLWKQLYEGEFVARRIITEVDAIKRKLGYYDAQAAEDNMLARQYDESFFEDIPF